MPSKKRSQRRFGFSEPKAKYVAPRLGGRDRGKGLRGKRRLPEPAALPDGTVRYFLTLGQKGRVLLPAEMRAALGLNEGDIITAWVKDGEVRMHSHLHGLQKIQEESRRLARGKVYASEELIADRRAENAKEERETMLALRRGAKKRI
jgi:AbrB family looped-hinge helix DNA binding protein